MRNEHNGSLPRTRRTSSTARRDDLADWRRLTRPVILDDFLDRTRDLRWSRELIDLLLDELHVSDEFDDLIGRVPPTAQVNYPQLVALALVLRHSWFPEDLARIIEEPGLSPSPTAPAVEHVPSPEVIDTANRRGLTSHSAPSPHICTPQKGEEQRC
jgi:hypothetical protein